MDTLRILTCGSRIKHLIPLMVLLPLPAWTQGVPTFTVQTNIELEYSLDFGGTISFSSFQGPGVNLGAMGGATCINFCNGNLFAPGSSLKPIVDLVDMGDFGPSGTVTIGGQQLDCQGTCTLGGIGINAISSVKFPTTGQNFTVTLPAVLNGLPIFGAGPLGQPFELQPSPGGELALSFAFGVFTSPIPSYQFESATFSTPEPGTLDLIMAAALAGIFGVVLRRRKLPRHSH